VSLINQKVSEALRNYAPSEITLGEMRDSAVLALIAEWESEQFMVLQVRTQTVAHHKGEISFPGGARDSTDKNLRDTALRETNEEMGIAPESIEILGALNDCQTYVSGYRIRPFVGLMVAEREADLSFQKAEREVRDVLVLPLETMMSPEVRIWHPVSRDGEMVPTRAYLVPDEGEEYLIWGATARILTNLFAIIDQVEQRELDEEGSKNLELFA
tara:strand:+ start:209 stop:853 length:645 start_codon:yes stop_codon:yes gene_type:complete